MSDRNKSVISGFLWRFAERCGAQGVSFIVTIVLARLLNPDVYGTISIILVFTTVLQVFIDSGMGSALIQKKNADDLDFSSVFFFNMIMCSFLYLILFFVAPIIAIFYDDKTLTAVIRVLGMTLIISGIKNVQQAYVARTMQFKRFFFATLGGTLGAAIVGIGMAYSGYGIWALVVQQLFNATVDTIILWLTVKWRPKKMFSIERIRTLFAFGWKLLVSSLLDTVYNNIRQLIIGKMYSSSDLAYYNRGKQFPDLIVNNINTSIDSVLLPTMSSKQDDTPIVKVVLTDKWLPCVPFMQIFCITSMFYPIHTANLNAIKALGRSDYFLKLEIIKKIIGIILLLSTMWYGVMAMAYSLLLSSFLSQIINSWPNKKLLDYGYIEQIKDILPSIFLAVIMGIGVFCVQFLELGNLLTICLQVILGMVIYIGGSVIFKFEEFEYIYKMIKGQKIKTKRTYK